MGHPAGDENTLVASMYEQTKAACVVQDRNPYSDQNQRSHTMAVAADWLAEGGVVDDPVCKKAPETGHHGEDNGKHCDFKGGADSKRRHVDAKVICTVCECEKCHGRDPRAPSCVGVFETALCHFAIPI